MRRSGRQNKLIQQVGEYVAVAELARRGFISTAFAGNVPEYDVIATDERGNHAAVQVKAARSLGWQFDVSRFCRIALKGRQQIIQRKLPSPIRKLVVLLIHVSTDGSERDRVFILSWTELRDLLVANHRRWLKRHHGVRPKNPLSTHVALSVQQVEEFEDRWSTVRKNLH